MKKRISTRIPPLEDVISLGLVLDLFLMRPAALGENFSSIAMVVAVVLAGAYLIVSRKKQRFTSPQLRIEMLMLGAFMAAYWLYVGPLTVLNNRSNLEFALKDIITTIVVVVPYSMILMDTRANGVFFRQLCTVVSLLGLSSLVTVILTSVLGSRDPLFLYTLNIKGYTDQTIDPTAATGAIYFPLSMLYTDFVSGTTSLDRFCGFFREAGIYQAFACFFLAYEAFTRRSWLVLLGLASGIILAFSSLGVVLFVLTIGLIYLFGSPRFRLGRMVVAAIMIGLSYPAAVYTPYIGLTDKLQTHGTSVTDRANAMSRGVQAVSDNPVGAGLFSSSGEDDGICLLSSIGMTGVFGFLCQFLILSGWRPGSRGSWRKVAACIPILVTALVSEPITGAPIVYILVMAYIPGVYRELANRRQTTSIPTSAAWPQADLGSGTAR
ncbi:hypothetical protein B0G57_115135 [Trinickia symbiotica]|uniref:O-antigen ligase domain-containing protein n=1 Tax=Trinickia symbiotica TaxID=863227 RepID=A0A2N7X5Y8_9BURK|nr:hypothetical protein [Trinickia symbiotica]PMS37037.1 hypothetical protein C0Z20_09970 [Trinickia symbiotica]PPK43031.1 hypothetical protein B0G57_115135 [Trinickia symbiotica]